MDGFDFVFEDETKERLPGMLACAEDPYETMFYNIEQWTPEYLEYIEGQQRKLTEFQQELHLRRDSRARGIKRAVSIKLRLLKKQLDKYYDVFGAPIYF